MLNFFKWDFLVTALALVLAYLYGGTLVVAITAILILVEVVFSFDNAAVNAKYLARLNHYWQQIFLTVGILIAVVGMRLLFPLLVVCISGGVTPWDAIQLAAEGGDPLVPGTYGYVLKAAHPAIAAFGGTFLFMLFLDFLFDREREITWLDWIEKPLLRAGRLSSMSTLVSSVILLLAAELLAGEDKYVVLMAGVAGLATYLAVSGIPTVMEEREKAKNEQLGHADSKSALSGAAAFSLFLFLEVLDASFSFDGVIGAFAITPDPVVIALGLGVGALYVRSMTVYLVRRKVLAQYLYLEHGAHWAIGALGVLLLGTLRWEIPDIVIGLVGIAFIGAAMLTSVKLKPEIPGEEDAGAPATSGAVLRVAEEMS